MFVNRYGNRLDKGEDQWEVSILGSEIPAIQLTDNNNGSYSVTYQTTVRGRLQVYISLNGRDMPESPYEVVSDTKVRRGLAQKMLNERKMAREKSNVSTVNEDTLAAQDSSGNSESEIDGDDDDDRQQKRTQREQRKEISPVKSLAAAPEDDGDHDADEFEEISKNGAASASQKKSKSLLDRMASVFCRGGGVANTPRSKLKPDDAAKLPKRGERLF